MTLLRHIPIDEKLRLCLNLIKQISNKTILILLFFLYLLIKVIHSIKHRSLTLIILHESTQKKNIWYDFQ